MKSLFVFLLFFSATVFSQENKVYEVDLDLGEEINEVCAGCHGEYAQGGKGGEYPRLAGLPVEYLREQLKLFKQRKRYNMPMNPYANDRELSDEDVVSVSAFIANIKLITVIPSFKPSTTAYEKLLIAKTVLNIARAEGDVVLGKKLYNKECKICHGRDAKGKKNSDTPALSGQYTKYLRKQIDDYNSKKRHHDYDDEDEAFQAYTPSELQAILAYISITDD